MVNPLLGLMRDPSLTPPSTAANIDTGKACTTLLQYVVCGEAVFLKPAGKVSRAVYDNKECYCRASGH